MQTCAPSSVLEERVPVPFFGSVQSVPHERKGRGQQKLAVVEKCRPCFGLLAIWPSCARACPEHWSALLALLPR